MAEWLVLGIFMIVFPGLTLGNAAAMIVVTGVAACAPSMRSDTLRSISYVLVAVSLLLGIGVILNAWYYTDYLGGTAGSPVLINDDSHRWWNDAVYHIDGDRGERAHAGFGLYGYVLACVLWLFGSTVGTALIWSMAMTLVALIMAGWLAFRLTRNVNVSALAIGCTAAVCYWLAMGTLILKEPFVFVAILTGALGLTYKKGRMFLAMAVATLMLSLSRKNFILYLVLGLFIVGVRKRNYVWPLITAGVCLAVWYAVYVVVQPEAFQRIISSVPTSAISYDAPNQMALYNIIGDYTLLPFYKKILYMPLSAVVQFFIPFPWNFARDVPFGITEAYAHFGYPWYLFGFCVGFFIIGQRHNFRHPVYRMTLWALVCWLVPCYLFGGTISRYGLPLVAVFAPAVALTIAANYRKRKFYGWLSAYCALVGIVLVVAHHLHKAAGG